ncbi:hypothetical protein DY000_02021396 [Brassica cretica]|uniref:Uncharacterized protein n=1 Tax=Brassica cretica TaxID=69181 RepID=A0ABQ7EAB1_BRACR|nr:hypothetical protein DY000_02021396 [Brassica cretica]
MAATKMFFRSGFGYEGFSDLEDFWAKDSQTTSRKFSDGVFNQMVLIFHLDMYFVCSIKKTTSKKSSRRLPRLDDFHEVFQTTSKKSSRRLPRSLPDDFKEVFQTTSTKSSSRLPRSLPDDFHEVFKTTSTKSSRRLPNQMESKLIFVEE